MWKSLRQRFRSTLRVKMLVLVLLPLALAMAATLGYTLYWFHNHTRESLHFAVRDDLTLARQALRAFQEEYQLALRRLADAPAFRAQLRAGNRTAIERTLRHARGDAGFAYLHVTGVAGNWLFEKSDGASKPSALTDRAGRGLPGAALEVFRPEELRRESPLLVAQARVTHRGEGGGETRGLMLRIVEPIAEESGRVSLILDAGVLLNQNQVLLDRLRKQVFASGTLPRGAQPMAALLLRDTRVAASSTAVDELVGTRIAPNLQTPLSKINDAWIGEVSIAGTDYITAYGPLDDVDGQRIGLLQVGMRAGAFNGQYYRTAGLFLLLFATAGGIAAWFAVRGVRLVVKPIEAIAEVARATAAGADDRRIGPVRAQDEVGALARQFDFMLDQLGARAREIQRNAEALEVKVAERTRELGQKNTELEATVSLLKQTREQLVLAEKLSALGQMAAGIAHEINNPAAVILGNLDVLNSDLGEHAKPVAREIELIAQQVERIRHIVTSLLQFARARPGVGEITEVDVNRVVEDVRPLVAHLFKQKRINFHCRLEAKTSVAASLYDLEQVLINLIANAVNACETGGEVVVTTANWDGGTTISVSDNGHGVAPDQLKHIFDPFFTTDLQHGVGLGLSVSYGLVHRVGGHITVDSAPGEGSVFRVWLLRHPEILDRPEMQRAATANQHKEMHYG